MKTKIIMCLSILFLGAFHSNLYAQVAAVTCDPALTAAIVGEQEALKESYKSRKKKHIEVLGQEIVISEMMDKIKKLQEKTIDYLSNASSAVQNLYEIKRMGELVIILPDDLRKVKRAIPHNLKGAAITAVVSDETKNIYKEIMALVPFVDQLVTSQTINIQDVDGKTKEKKVNLLNAYERYYILNNIITKLESIHMSLYFLEWQIRTLNFSDLWRNLTPELWMNYITIQGLSDNIMYYMRQLKYY